MNEEEVIRRLNSWRKWLTNKNDIEALENAINAVEKESIKKKCSCNCKDSDCEWCKWE